MRTIIIAVAVVAVAVGVAALGWRGGSGEEGAAARLQQEKDALAHELAVAARDLEAQKAEFERTRLENDRLRSQLGDLERQLRRAAALAEPVEDVDPLGPDFVDDFSQAAISEPEGDISDRRRRGRDGENTELTEEEREIRRLQWEERRQEFANRMRENVSNFYTARLEEAGDAGSQQRILAMEDYSNYMMDLFQQMRATDDEEERTRLREEMDSARETMRTLVNEQQDQMLRNLASEMGVHSGARQEEFVTRMRETMEDPFFQSRGIVGGGGGRRGSWGGGGFGNWGGGGGRPEGWGGRGGN